ncbi:MAG: mono/diheme cytochrome c family protein, partial [Neolewinella sp.]
MRWPNLDLAAALSAFALLACPPVVAQQPNAAQPSGAAKPTHDSAAPSDPLSAARAAAPAAMFAQHCMACHGRDKQKGEVRFDTLAELAPAERTDLLNRALEMVELKEMPPEDEPQLSIGERQRIRSWLTA